MSEFWISYQPGFRFTQRALGTKEFYEEVDRNRHDREPHIGEFAQFNAYGDRDVLDLGCGIATDGVRFARANARYVGVDQSTAAIALARRRFALEQLPGAFVQADATGLPFSDKSFDLVWSHGVVHHIQETGRAIHEIHRVLRPGGVAVVMVYHRNSLNYLVTIMIVRRLLALVLLVPGGVALIAKVTGEDKNVLDGHVELLREYGYRYLLDRKLFLSNNTDGPGNPLSKVFTDSEARKLFGSFAHVVTHVRFLNARLYPGGRWLEKNRLGRWMSYRLGWHLYVCATKAPG